MWLQSVPLQHVLYTSYYDGFIEELPCESAMLYFESATMFTLEELLNFLITTFSLMLNGHCGQ